MRATEPRVDATGIPQPTVQTAVTTCRSCKQAFIEAPGEAIPIDASTAALLTCDADDIGDLESDEPTRVKPSVPASIRRKVFHRDHFMCIVPGCRSTRFLAIHHLKHRKDGGDHTMPNLGTICGGCHQRHHDGDLLITGEAPDRLQFAWRHDDDVDSPMSGPTWDWVEGA